jgi:hypothetical protein
MLQHEKAHKFTNIDPIEERAAIERLGAVQHLSEQRREREVLLRLDAEVRRMSRVWLLSGAARAAYSGPGSRRGLRLSSN